VFLDKNSRIAALADLVEALEDELFQIRETSGGDKFPKSTLEYLNDWAATEKGWLRVILSLRSSGSLLPKTRSIFSPFPSGKTVW